MIHVSASLSLLLFFFLMIRRPPRSTLDRSSAASDVYKRQVQLAQAQLQAAEQELIVRTSQLYFDVLTAQDTLTFVPVSYTHLRAHETVLDLVCRLLLEKKKQ